MGRLLINLIRRLYILLPIGRESKEGLKSRFYFWFPRLKSFMVSAPAVTARRKSVVLRALYDKLPISEYHKYRMAGMVFKALPFVFGALPEYKRWNPLSDASARPWDAILKTSEHELKLDSFALPVSAEPLVSVIIPVYGKVEYTLMCLRSIARSPIRTAYEVIVVDDCSPDDTLVRLARIDGLRVVSNETNQGFIRSCNAGAAAARGAYLCFLNNDTQICDGWLDELVRTFDDFDDVGLAGSRLVYPNGQLQEAGGIIWQDGSAWNYGRFQDPTRPEFNYAREVDYISGASILIRKDLFDEFGGFDELYLPAYGEDSDLALKVRNRGLKVMYQPLSIVIHYEGITSGTDTKQGVKAYQVANAQKLYERWKNLLAANEPQGGDVDRAKDRGCRYRVLVLDVRTPTPDKDAGSITVFNLLLLLRQMGFQVTFIPTGNLMYRKGYTEDLGRAGVEVLYAPYTISVRQHLKRSGKHYDLAFLFRPQVAQQYLKTVRRLCPQAKVLYHTVDLHYLRMMREAGLTKDEASMREALKMKRDELDAIRGADASIVHSTVELEMLRPELPGKLIHVFPLIMNVRHPDNPFSKRHDIMFIGGYQHSPNIDAVRFFANEVMPLIRPRLPGARFLAVGSGPPPEIQALNSGDVVITGYVKDLDPLLDQMRISVAPLRYGAGIKGKIGTAMAVGLPVVGTTLAAEGMSLTHGENFLIADSPQELADAIVRLYNDEALWNRLSSEGLKFAEREWGGEAAWNTLHDILASMGIQTVHNRHPVRLYSSRYTSITQSQTSRAVQPLEPLGICRTRNEYGQLLKADALKQLSSLEDGYVQQAKDRESFTLEGYCAPCGREVQFLVDKQSGAQHSGALWVPNWRERMECPVCRMNNRQRLIATLVKDHLQRLGKQDAQVYFMEQVTPIFAWANKALKDHRVTGSEYLGYEYRGGSVIHGIRHEDVMSLSFGDGTIDLIVSNDVFEHVPEPGRALAECARVLKPGGVMLATIPFHAGEETSVARAALKDGQLVNLLPPVYHGNPVSKEGSIVFTDFGWDLLADMVKCGFAEAAIEVYGSKEHGHLGGGQLVFRARKG